MPGLGRIADAVVRQAGPISNRDVLDLGAGSGQLALQLAGEARSVMAVDFSAVMLGRLKEKAAELGIDNIETVHSSIEKLDLPADSIDVVVSNYALHHLTDPEKAKVVARAARWLRPGGVLVIGDMMFSIRGGSADRRIIASKVAQLARRGPGGWWRIVKNSWRFVIAKDECPASLESWKDMLGAAGFNVVCAERVVAEGGVVGGRLPDL